VAVKQELEKMGYIIDMGKRGRKLRQKENIVKQDQIKHGITRSL
jgi:biotin operon repressor